MGHPILSTGGQVEILVSMMGTIRPDTLTRQSADSAQACSARETQVLIDAFSQGQVQHWVDLEVHQLGAGAYQGACTSLSSERMHLVHEQQNRLIHKTGMLPKNTCTLSFFLRQSPAMRFSHIKTPEPHTFFLPEDSELDILVPDDVDTLYLCLEQDRLLAGARLLNPGFWEHPPRGLHAFNTPETQRLAAGFLSLLNRDVNTELCAQTEAMLIDWVLLALHQSTEVLGSDRPEHSSRLGNIQRVNRAREFIEASLQNGQVPSIVDLCAHARSSERALQYAFREVLHMTPVAYLRTLRLNRVRNALQTAVTADTTVTQVATRWGFFHLGKFAADYCQLFGERPSETLARAKISK